MLNDALGHTPPTPLTTSRLDGTAYELNWPLNNASRPEDGHLPTLDYAIYLVNTVKFHLGQLYHIFDETTFEKRLREYYAADHRNSVSNIWLVQLLVVLAFGKAFLTRSNTIARPPGAKYFERALSLLPAVHQLHDDAVTTVEAYCAIALYEQSVEHRNSAYTHVRTPTLFSSLHQHHNLTLGLLLAWHCASRRIQYRFASGAVHCRF